MFEHFDDAARRSIVLTQEEARRLGHPEIGAEHLLLGIARIDEPLVGTAVERLRASVVAQQGVGDSGPNDVLQFTPEALAALEGANEQALARGHTIIGPAHLLLSVLDADGVARRVLRETGLIVADIRERADAAARSPRPPDPGKDLDLLARMLASDGPAARLLRAHGIDEAAIDAALDPGEPG